MGRPEFKVSEALRRRVAIAAGGGMSHEEIAIAIGIDRNTLKKHFEAELSTGAFACRIEVLEAMHAAAGKGNVTAQRAYLERDPELAAPPAPVDQPEPVLGKKEQAQADAKTAARGTTWDSLLPKPGDAPRLQ